jgi:hypothetical protein
MWGWLYNGGSIWYDGAYTMRRYIDNSFGRSVVYTLGHIIIATMCNVFITGDIVKLALTDAIAEPLCNGVWYYVLDVM